jgi:hypothetical protein
MAQAPIPLQAGRRRVAAIDIGTNSIHLLIAEVDEQLPSFSVLLAEKATTRLGERDPVSGDLSSEAMERAFRTLRHDCQLAESYGVEQIVTAATSAVREAPNGGQFLQTLLDQLSLEVDLVSGPEEARLIYLGVLSGMAFGDRPHSIIDIGGGSTELVLADGSDARVLTSTRIGAVRSLRGLLRHRIQPTCDLDLPFLVEPVQDLVRAPEDAVGPRWQHACEHRIQASAPAPGFSRVERELVAGLRADGANHAGNCADVPCPDRRLCASLFPG